MASPLLKPVHLGYNPSRRDVQIAALILIGLRLRAMPGHLPSELALSILADARYHPRDMSSRAEEREYHADDFWEPGPRASVAALYLTTQALPPYFRRASCITLQMRSADQGWATFGGDGTYDNSHTWFEVSILRPLPNAPAPMALGPEGAQQSLEVHMPQSFRSPGDAKQELERQGWCMVNHNGRDTWMVHHNITARHDWKDYRVDWLAGEPTENENPEAVGDGEGFLSALMPGDKIGLWARAEQQAWVMRVAEALIEIAYVV